MSANPIWIAGYFGPVAGAAPVWIAPGDGTVPSAVQSEIVSYYAPVAGATAVWIAGFFAPPPAAIGATPITISGWGGSGGGGSGGSTSVWSAADAAANGMTLSNGGLTAAGVGAGWKSLRSTVSKTSGKLYFECFIINNASTGIIMGLADAGFVISSYLGTSPQSTGLGGLGIIMDDRAIVSGGFTSKGTVPNVPAANDVWGFAVDFTGGNIWVAINNVWAIGGNPATGSLPVVTFVQATVGALFAGVSLYDPSNSVTLQSTAASQKYAPPSGFSAWDGGAAPSHSAQALAYLARTVGGDEGGNGANIATLIDGLVSDGVWAKLDALYVLAQQNQTDALLNLVGTSYGLTTVGLAKPGPRVVTFTSYVGFGGFSQSIYLDTGLDPSVAPTPHYTTNDASFGIWSYQILSSPNSQGGRSDSTAIYNKFSDGNFIAAVNGAGFPRTPTLITKGLFSTERRDAANVYPYQNGVSAGAIVNASGADTGNFEIGHIGAPGGPNYTDQTLCAAFIGASLGAAGQLALYNRLRTYMTAVGVP